MKQMKNSIGYHKKLNKMYKRDYQRLLKINTEIKYQLIN